MSSSMGSMGGSATAACLADFLSLGCFAESWIAPRSNGSLDCFTKHFNDAIALAGAEVLY